LRRSSKFEPKVRLASSGTEFFKSRPQQSLLLLARVLASLLARVFEKLAQNVAQTFFKISA
jgi:hypothetical protein